MTSHNDTGHQLNSILTEHFIVVACLHAWASPPTTATEGRKLEHSHPRGFTWAITTCHFFCVGKFRSWNVPIAALVCQILYTWRWFGLDIVVASVFFYPKPRDTNYLNDAALEHQTITFQRRAGPTLRDRPTRCNLQADMLGCRLMCWCHKVTSLLRSMSSEQKWRARLIVPSL